MAEFDIYNDDERKVVCKRVGDSFGGSNGVGKLEIGKEYTVDSVSIHNWHTEVFLKEFQNETVGFNSVLFDEV